MANLGASVGWGLLVGGSLVVGALAAVLLHLPERVAATLTAFGGGILFAAIALELVPDADAGAGTALTAAGLAAGTLLYVGADAWLNREPSMRAMRRSAHAAASGRAMAMPRDHAEAARGESIAAGIFVDGVPESIALGLTVADGEVGVALLAGIRAAATSSSPTAPRSRSSPAVTRAASPSACWAGSASRSRARPSSAAPCSRTRAPSSSAPRRRSPPAPCSR